MDNTKKNSFINIVDSGNIEEVKDYINFGQDLDEKYGKIGNTALISACSSGKLAIAKLLIECGADINLSNEDGDSPLIYACKYGQIEIVELLTELGADIELKNNGGLTALMCSTAHIEIVGILINAGADVDAVCNYNSTALMYAATDNSKTKVVAKLIADQTDLNIQAKDGRTALMIATDRNVVEALELLIEAGADINIQDEEGSTALMIAASSVDDNPTIVRMLIKAGADINIINYNGLSAFDNAFALWHNKTITTLIKRGANISNALEADEDIMRATILGDCDRVRDFILEGANINAQTTDHKYSLLMIASMFNHAEIVKLFIEAKANIKAQSDNNWTAIKTASKNNNQEIIYILESADFS